MKTLNRTLSLVLVLVMVLGLFGVASAKFTDDAKIEYKEAVDVMSAIGVMDGMGNNTFDPAANLTREQAAKIICYLTMGKAAADKLVATAAPFKDVAADRWSPAPSPTQCSRASSPAAATAPLTPPQT